MPRNLSIDRLRGLLVLMMVIGDYLGGVQFVPAILKHAPDIGFTIADTVAPCFIFVIGLNMGPAFVRRLRESPVSAYGHALTRNLALIGIGAILTAGGTELAGKPTTWGVLQAIGLAGLICLVFIRLPIVVRFVVGLLLLGAYQFALDNLTLSVVLHSAQGGFVGGISWGALLILSTAVADIWRKGLPSYAICCAALGVVGALSALIVPVSKNRVSLSFVLLTLAISAIAFLFFELGARALPKRSGFFCWWGENALALYILQLLLLGFVTLPRVGWWYAGASPGLAALQLGVILVSMSVTAWLLHRHRVRVTL
ncbi:MAG: heparan-alpha-glucosaminide N-acetyltransferase domain-containing protein [Actinomycetota bacterium]